MWGVAGGLKELMRAAQKAKSLPDVRPRRQRANLYSNYDASVDFLRSIIGGHFRPFFVYVTFIQLLEEFRVELAKLLTYVLVKL